MTYEKWLASVPRDLTDDSLWRMEVYRLALFAGETENVVTHRLKFLTKIIRLLLSIIPVERGYKLAEDGLTYGSNIQSLLDNPPMP